MAQKSKNTKKSDPVMECLHEIFQSEMSGIIRYMHYSFMIMGHNRIPIQKWFRDQATESMGHAVIIGEKITSLGGHPPIVSATIQESNKHSINEILKESLVHESSALELYKRLVTLVPDDVALDELARGFVLTETDHIDEVKKMLKST